MVEEARGSIDALQKVKMIGAFPHAIKVVPVETSASYTKLTPGSYHLLWFDESATGKEFRVSNINGDATLPNEATASYVYTTRGIAQQMGWGSQGGKIADNLSGGASSTRIVGYFNQGDNKIYTNYDTSCEKRYDENSDQPFVCVQKGDKLLVVDGCWGQGDDVDADDKPIFGGVALNLYHCPNVLAPNKNSGNIYTVTKVYTVPLALNSATSPTTLVDITSGSSPTIVNTNIIEVESNFPWSGMSMGDPENSDTINDGTTWSKNTGTVILFHFTPHEDESYEHTSQCSNRGLCDSVTGLCTCFRGYTGEDCSIQSILAK
jgi:hypothetical protein